MFLADHGWLATLGSSYVATPWLGLRRRYCGSSYVATPWLGVNMKEEEEKGYKLREKREGGDFESKNSWESSRSLRRGVMGILCEGNNDFCFCLVGMRKDPKNTTPSPISQPLAPLEPAEYRGLNEFCKRNPSQFQGGFAPDASHEWIQDLERVFRAMGCNDVQKVAYLQNISSNPISTHVQNSANK
ncbi:hypothetical protein Lal_00015120 [Lupinus albus]|nr:hypothetical protein Lal_00015120 [Lupinus albus]